LTEEIASLELRLAKTVNLDVLEAKFSTVNRIIEEAIDKAAKTKLVS
jgi:hypothetical protein